MLERMSGGCSNVEGMSGGCLCVREVDSLLCFGMVYIIPLQNKVNRNY